MKFSDERLFGDPQPKQDWGWLSRAAHLLAGLSIMFLVPPIVFGAILWLFGIIPAAGYGDGPAARHIEAGK